MAQQFSWSKTDTLIVVAFAVITQAMLCQNVVGGWSQGEDSGAIGF